MSDSIVSQLAGRARDCALAAVWAQWGVINPMLLPDPDSKPASSIIDPEALVLASLALWHAERRLADVLAWWAATGAPLMSTRRTATLTRDIPAANGSRLGQFAAWAREGGDTRWKGDASGEIPVRPGKGPPQLALRGPSTLLLRLRAGFGVSAKPDVLAFLVALDGEGATSREIVRATGYADPNVRAAAHQLALGGFVEERESHPVSYAAPSGFPRAFVRLIERDAPNARVPGWRDWAAVYAFLVAVASWEAQARLANPYVLSSEARDLFERYAWVFGRAGLRVPDPRRYRGEEYLTGFGETLDVLCDWAAARV